MIAVEAAARRQGARHAPSSQHPPLGGKGERLRLFVEGRAVQPSAGSKQGEGAGASSTALPTTYRKRQRCAPLGACTSHGWVRTQQAPCRAVPLQQLPAGSLCEQPGLCACTGLPKSASAWPHVRGSPRPAQSDRDQSRSSAHPRSDPARRPRRRQLGRQQKGSGSVSWITKRKLNLKGTTRI